MEDSRLRYAVEKWAARREKLGPYGYYINSKLTSYPAPIREWMTYLAATLPSADLPNYPLSVWIPYIEHALKVREEFPWCKELPEDMFVDYVFYPRINTEDIECPLEVFYNELKPRIEGKTLEQAVLEVNYWCQEHATYQMADDRTKSAMTVYRSCGGRCGEESTFTVAALRSVGIPARQVYAPWWSHCDDNHAWVEVYINGKWHFTGACEPAPRYDVGWFTNASSRAMAVHARTFTGAQSREDLVRLYGERADRFHVEGGVTYELVTDHYALTSQLSVQVLDQDELPAKGITVRFEVLNMAEMMPVATLTTDEKGEVSLMLGRGQIRIHAYNEDGSQMAEVDYLVSEEADQRTVVRLADPAKETFGEWEAFDFYAPIDYPVNPGILSDEEKKQRSERMEHGNALRLARIDSFYDAERADAFSEEMKERLHAARGNFDTIASFLEYSTEEEKPYREALLSSLTAKDMTDVRRDVLEEHLICALPYAEKYPREIFVPYVLCPRIDDEGLRGYRVALMNYFDKNERLQFQKDPRSIVNFIDSVLKTNTELEYPDLLYMPAGSLFSCLTNYRSRRIMFVAICRTFGIPARLNPVTREAEFYRDGKFIPAVDLEKANVRLILKGEDPKEWIDRQTLTVQKLVNGVYKRMNLPEISEDGVFEVDLTPGQYRVLTVRRLPNGHMYAYVYRFKAHGALLGKETIELALNKRSVDLSEILSHNEIHDFKLKDADGQEVKVSEQLVKPCSILIWIEEGKEPTEHILNEMLSQAEDFRHLEGDIFFILHDEEAKQQVTLKKALEAFPNVKILYDDFKDNVNTLGRRMYVDCDKLPLVILLHDGLTGVYASSGYNVGLGDILVKLVKALTK